MASDDGHVGIEVDGGLGLTRDTADAADVDLGQHVTGRLQPAGQGNDRRQRRLERASPSASQPDPAWKWSVSTARSCRRRAASVLIESIGRDAQLGRSDPA